MIGGQRIRHEGTEEEMIKLAQQGKIETILRYKTSIDLQNLFPTISVPLVCLPRPLPLGRVILIEGPPGGGKSTLALHICHQWANSALWLERFDLIILAYLRDESIQKAKSLADILPAYTLDMSQSRQKISLKMQGSLGARALFIFDGWDEFPPDLMNNSVVSTIIRQPQKLSLHQSVVIVTSRPVSSGNLLHVADRRVEILGFTPQKIHEYIEKALDGNSSHIQKLVQHLEEYPVIEGYCYVPLHVAILVHIFLTMKGVLPTTLHQLFCSLILCCIVREQATHKLDIDLPELTSLDDLPDGLKLKLSRLTLLAYNGVLQNKVVFYLKDLPESCLPTDVSSLGLLQAVEGLTLTNKSLSYNFLHLSVQELLAAYRISQINPSEQVRVFKKLFGNSRFQAVLHYYSGFTKLAHPEIQEFVFHYQHKKSNIVELLPLLHCFFEAQQPSLCQLVNPWFVCLENQQLLDSNKIFPIDFLAIGFFIASLLSTPASTASVHISICNISDRDLRLLFSEVTKNSSREANKKLILHLYKPLTTEQGAKHLASHLKKSHSISEIILSDGDIKAGLVHIAEALQKNSSVIKLSLCNMELQHTEQNGSALTKIIQSRSNSLTHLDLSGNTTFLNASCADCIFKSLQHNATLVYLNLSNTGLTARDPDTARSLTKMLQVNNSLIDLDLSENSTFSDIGACAVFDGLQDNTTLVNLELSKTGIKCTDSDMVKSLVKMLQVNKTLVHLNVSQSRKFSISSTSVVHLEIEYIVEYHLIFFLTELSKLKHPSGVYTNFDGSLSCRKLVLYFDTSVTAGAKHMASHLKQSPAISELVLFDSGDEDGLLQIAEALQTNSSLIKLSLCFVHLQFTDQNGSALAKMFHTNRSLTHLNLSGAIATFLDSGIHSIVEGLQQNTALINLNLYIGDTLKTDSLSYQPNQNLLCNFSPIVYLQIEFINDCHLESLLFTLSGYGPFGGLANEFRKLILHLYQPSITRQGIINIASHLTESPAISELILSSFHCDVDSLFHIAKALQTNSSLTKLILCHSNLQYTKQNSFAVIEMLRFNKSLTHLDLSGK